MTDRVDLIFRYRVTDQARFDEYPAKVVPVTEAHEPYVLEYHLFRRDDGTMLQHERYENEAAVRRHMAVTAEGQADWAAATELLDLMAIGELSPAFWDDFDGPAVSKWSRFREAARDGGEDRTAATNTSGPGAGPVTAPSLLAGRGGEL